MIGDDRVISFLEAIGEGDAVETFRLAAQSDALDWMERTLSFAAALGVKGDEMSAIVCETVDQIGRIAGGRRGRA